MKEITKPRKTIQRSFMETQEALAMETQERFAEDDYLGVLEFHYKKPYDQLLKEEAILEEDEEEQMYLLKRSLRYRKLINKKKHEQIRVKKMKVTNQKGKKPKRKIIEKDDSKETLELLLQWKNNTPRNPPRYIIGSIDIADRYSEPIHKQLMNSDVKEDQCRLMLGKEQVKKMMNQVLGESERSSSLGVNGVEVMVYGPCGEVYEMVFKMWNGDTPVLMSKEWNEYVKRYELLEFGYFLTIWMFRHKESRKICFAIDSCHLSVRKMLSRRILKTVFKDQH